MSVDFTKLFGQGGALLGPTLSTNFFESRTWIAPQDGIVIVRGMGAGGAGAKGSISGATGGYSGSWGCKILRVKKGDTVDVLIGAGGVPADGAGGAGGNTVVTVGGVQYIAYGGFGGVNNTPDADMPNGPAQSANWDFGAASVRPRGVTISVSIGGAGVDIFAQGNNATSAFSSGGGGTGGRSDSADGGG